MACTWSACRSPSGAWPIRAAAAHPTARATLPRSAVMASCRIWNASWRARSVCGWPLSPAGCGVARELSEHGAFADPVALARNRPEPAGVDNGRVSVAYLHSRRVALAGSVQRPQARPTPYLRMGHLVRGSLSCVCLDGAAGQLRRALGGLDDSAAGICLVLHYDFVLASFSSASRMKGMVSRR